MRKMSGVFVAAAVLAGPVAAAEAPSRADLSQRDFEHQMFQEAGFRSIAEVNADGRAVRRVLLQDPYGMLPVPAMEFERKGDGAVTLRLQYRGWSAQPVALDRGVWADLAQGEDAAFARPKPDMAAGKTKTPATPPPICHGWIVRLEADYRRTRSWAGCGGQEDATLAYTLKAIALAMATRPDCRYDPKNAFWSFNTCFAAKRELDDPALEAKVAPLRKLFEGNEGADLLAAARQGVAAPGLAPGNPAWLSARDAVRRVGALQSARRDAAQKLRSLAYSATGEADRARMRQLADWSTESVTGQEPNYADLLERLAGIR